MVDKNKSVWSNRHGLKTTQRINYEAKSKLKEILGMDMSNKTCDELKAIHNKKPAPEYGQGLRAIQPIAGSDTAR